MNRLACILLASALLRSHAAAAAQWSSGTTTITMIEVSDPYGSGASVLLSFNTAPISTTCSRDPGALRRPPSLPAAHAFPSSGQWLVKGSNSNVKNILTVATSAKLAGRPVKVYWNGQCSQGGTGGYPVASGLQLF